MNAQEFTTKDVKKHKPWIEFIGFDNWNKLVGQIYDNGYEQGRKQTLMEVLKSYIAKIGNRFDYQQDNKFKEQLEHKIKEASK